VHLKAQIIRELDRLELLLEQLKSVGPETAAVLWSEGLFRQFDNRRHARQRKKERERSKAEPRCVSRISLSPSTPISSPSPS
jgi:transposase